MMKKRSTDSQILFKYKRGELSSEEALLLEEELKNNSVLRTEMELINSIDTIENVYAPDEQRWQRIENNVFQNLNQQPLEKKSFFIFRPAFAAVFSLLLLIVASLYLIPDNKTEDKLIRQENPQIAKISPEIKADTKPIIEEFNTGSIKSSGISSQFSVLHSKGKSNAQKLQSADKIKAGNTLFTGANGFLHFAFNENVKISMLENTAIRFHEFDGQVMPYLEKGTVVIDIKHDQTKKFVLLAEKTRFYDIGTLFAVKLGKGDGLKVEVEKGEVLVERPQNVRNNIKAGNKLIIKPTGETIKVALNQSKSESIKQAEAILRLFIEEEQKEIVNKKPVKVREKIYNYPKTKPVVKEMPANETEVSKTGWQDALDKYTRNEKHAIAKFFKITEEYMSSGRTVRAIANLENFINQNPGKISERALFLLGECHYNLQEYDKSRKTFKKYLDSYPYGTWSEIARMRFIELKNMKE